MSDREPELEATPTLHGALIFQAKASALRAKRAVSDLVDGGPARHAVGVRLAQAPVLAVSRSPLWTATGGPKDQALTAGKVRNLQLAAASFDGVEVEAGETLSFWRQVGRPTARRGFVPGRELREGCMIATVGGGLCQLSNALFEVALDAGLEIVERHAHSRVVPGSRAEAHRDATVFWNYVDLRVRTPRPLRIDVRLTDDDLEMTLRGDWRAAAASAPTSGAPRAQATDCLSCGRTSCPRHNPEVSL